MTGNGEFPALPGLNERELIQAIARRLGITGGVAPASILEGVREKTLQRVVDIVRIHQDYSVGG
jgi:hypothetical protein